MKRLARAAACLAAFVGLAGGAIAQQDAKFEGGSGAAAGERFIVVQSTTSTENSGLFKHLLPQFTKATGIEVRVVAVGTGQAIKNAQNGDGDVLVVHDKAAEEKFVADGFGVARFDLMYNDYIIAGPQTDPARIEGGKDAAAAFAKIASAGAPFLSRGDKSGTHEAELRLWREAKVDAKAASGTWYREAGQGMGATLNTAVGIGAYVFSDRASWSSFKNRSGYAVMVEGDPRLFNQYGVIQVNPARHPHVKAADGKAFVDWLLSAQGQAAIGAFQIEGERQFVPNAKTR
jgi:tungstate transport system substrate-binding protein